MLPSGWRQDAIACLLHEGRRYLESGSRNIQEPAWSWIVAGRHKGKVYVNFDQDGAAVLLAFDARTGAPAWQAERTAFRACYSTPFVLDRPDGGQELVVSSTAGVTGYDLDKGSVNWNYTWHFQAMALRTVGSPIGTRAWSSPAAATAAASAT